MILLAFIFLFLDDRCCVGVLWIPPGTRTPFFHFSEDVFILLLFLQNSFVDVEFRVDSFFLSAIQRCCYTISVFHYNQLSFNKGLSCYVSLYSVWDSVISLNLYIYSFTKFVKLSVIMSSELFLLHSLSPHVC